MQENSVEAPCSSCHRKTNQTVLHVQEHDKTKTDDPFADEGISQYFVLRCAGCGTISFARLWKPWRGEPENENEWTYYPSPISRKPPHWASRYDLLDADITALLWEIYAAVNGGQHRLAAMGIRALLEHVMINKVGDHGGFWRNLDEFHKASYISLFEHDAIKIILDAGHAAAHRAFKPSDEELETALDVTEGILAAIFIHPNSAKELDDRIPPRAPPIKKQS